MRHRSKSSAPSVPKSMWDAEIATHPCLDQGLARLRVVREIVDGVPNPFVIGEEGYRYYETQFYNLVKRAREGEKPVH